MEIFKDMELFRPFELPKKRMINGVEISDSDSDGESKIMKRKDRDDPAAREDKKVALIIDTNVLLKRTELREMLKVPDVNTFNERFEVITLDSVI